jgi:hypothetical protein
MGDALQGSHPLCVPHGEGTVVQQGFGGRNIILYKEFNY